MREDEFEVCIDSALENGSLTYGECYLPGESPAEVLISCHACHPSLCNDNLSSVAVATFLAKHLGEARLRGLGTAFYSFLGRSGQLRG